MRADVLLDLLFVVHALFALFVVLGGFLAVRWRALLWLHVPAMLWGAAVEFGGWICPLTPLENRLRAASGHATYAGDFIFHYLDLALYPPSLTRAVQISLGCAVLALNATAYGLLWRQRRRS